MSKLDNWHERWGFRRTTSNTCRYDGMTCLIVLLWIAIAAAVFFGRLSYGQETYDATGTVKINGVDVPIEGELTLTKQIVGDDDDDDDDDDDNTEPPPEGIYVDATEGSDQDAGTILRPVQSLRKALELAGDGAPIFLQRGEVWKPKQRWIFDRHIGTVIDAYDDGPPPIIDGSDTPKHKSGHSQPSFGGLVEFRNCDKSGIQHIDVQNSQNTGIYFWEGSDCFAKWNTVRNCRAWAIFCYASPPSVGTRCVRPVIVGNDCHKLCQSILEPVGAGEGPDAFGEAGGEAIHLGRCNDYLIYGNRVWDYAKEGISLAQDCWRGKCFGNFVFGADKTIYQKYSAGVCYYLNPHRGNSRDIHVFNNVCIGDYTGVALASEEGGNIENVLIENNICVDVRDGGLAIIGSYRGPDRHGWARNVRMRHNTVVHKDNRVLVNIIQRDKLPGLDVAGNLLVRPGGTTSMISNRGSVPGVHDNQLWNGGSRPRGTGADPILADPKLSDQLGSEWPAFMVVGAERKRVPVLAGKYRSTDPLIDNQGPTSTDITGAERSNMTHAGAFR